MTISNTLEASQKEFDEKFLNETDFRGYIIRPEYRDDLKSFLHSSNLRVLEAVDAMLEGKKGKEDDCNKCSGYVQQECFNHNHKMRAHNASLSAIQEELRKFTK